MRFRGSGSDLPTIAISEATAEKGNVYMYNGDGQAIYLYVTDINNQCWYPCMEKMIFLWTAI